MQDIAIFTRKLLLVCGAVVVAGGKENIRGSGVRKEKNETEKTERGRICVKGKDVRPTSQCNKGKIGNSRFR
jgi:hypothetical protein